MISFAKIVDPNKELSSGWMVFILPVKMYSKQHFWSVSAMEVVKAPNVAEIFSKDQPDDHQHPNKCCKYVQEEQVYNVFKTTAYCLLCSIYVALVTFTVWCEFLIPN